VEVVGSVLVRNEDVFVERAIRNVAAFCDRIHVLDQQSIDGTSDILRRLEMELDHVHAVRSPDAAESHRVLERYAGSPTWILGVDGDELYDPAALARLRASLMAGDHQDVFRLKGNVLNCDELRGTTASGFLAPPSRPVTKLFNMAAVTAWTGCPERLHAGSVEFRDGFDWGSMRFLSDELGWERDPLRLLHVCFLRRSTRNGLDPEGGRLSMWETGVFRRGPRGIPRRIRFRRYLDPRVAEYRRAGTNWKQEWYRRGVRVSVDAAPFVAG
jgi:hypothetical protein